MSEDPRNIAVPPGAPLTDVPTKVTLLTLCGCSRTFMHGNRASLGMEWTAPLRDPKPRWLDPDRMDPPRTRRFKFIRFEHGHRDHWVYEEVP